MKTIADKAMPRMMKHPERAADHAHQEEASDASADDVYFPASRSRRAYKERERNIVVYFIKFYKVLVMKQSITQRGLR